MGSVNSFSVGALAIIVGAILLVVGVALIDSLNAEVCDGGNSSSYAVNVIEPGSNTFLSFFFEPNGSENSTYYFSIDRDGAVTSATVNLTGSYYHSFSSAETIQGAALVSYGTHIDITTPNYTKNSLHAFFYDSSGIGDLMHAWTNSTTEWDAARTETFAPQGGSGLSGGIDSGYNPNYKQYFVSYQDSNGFLELANGTIGSWSFTTLDNVHPNTGEETSIVAYRADQPNRITVYYHDDLNNALNCSSWMNGTSVLSSVDNSGNTGRYPEAYYYGAGRYGIFYLNETSKQLLFGNELTCGAGIVPSVVQPGEVNITNFGACYMNSEHHAFYVSDNNLWHANGSAMGWNLEQLANEAYDISGQIDVYCAAADRVAYIFGVDSTNDRLLYWEYDAIANTTTPTKIIGAVNSYVSTTQTENSTLPVVAYNNIITTSNAYFRYSDKDYPNDVCFDVGDDGYCEFLQTGAHIYENESSFTAELNNHLSGCATDPCNVTVLLNSSTTGNESISNINIQYTLTTPGSCAQAANQTTLDFMVILGDFGGWFSIIIICFAVAVIIIMINKYR